jgi:hypothetical protein
MSDLYQDAILDAKALRASVIANTKAALEEAFEPKIQAMFRSQIVEELEETEEIEEVEDMEEGMDQEVVGGMENEEYSINEDELEEILSQLEELSNENTDETLQEADDDEEPADDDEETSDETEDDSEEAEDSTEDMTDDTKIIDITLGDLKQVLQSVVSGQTDLDDLGGDDMSSDELGGDADTDAEADISLDEILAELEEDEQIEETEDMEEGLGSAISGGLKKFGSNVKKAWQDEYSPNAMKKAVASGKGYSKLPSSLEEKSATKELQEAKKTIEILSKNLQEVNLLNAKYLYMNKLFKKPNLSESQKVKVINALDRAKTVTEVKNTYETLKESLEVKKTQQLKESIGFASQAAGVAPKGNIVDSDPYINRWQKLAGIK